MYYHNMCAYTYRLVSYNAYLKTCFKPKTNNKIKMKPKKEKKIAL